MIALDTNVLVRYLTDDDPEQRERARDLIVSSERIFVGTVVMAETYWALAQVYGYPRRAILDAFAALLASDAFEFEERDTLEAFVSGPPGDLADAFIARAAERRGAGTVYTFDRRAANRIDAMELVP